MADEPLARYITWFSLMVWCIHSLAPSSRRLIARRCNHSRKIHADIPTTMRQITRTVSTRAVLPTSMKSTRASTTTVRRSRRPENRRPQWNTPYLRPAHKVCNLVHRFAQETRKVCFPVWLFDVSLQVNWWSIADRGWGHAHSWTLQWEVHQVEGVSFGVKLQQRVQAFFSPRQ